MDSDRFHEIERAIKSGELFKSPPPKEVFQDKTLCLMMMAELPKIGGLKIPTERLVASIDRSILDEEMQNAISSLRLASGDCRVEKVPSFEAGGTPSDQSAKLQDFYNRQIAASDPDTQERINRIRMGVMHYTETAMKSKELYLCESGCGVN